MNRRTPQTPCESGWLSRESAARYLDISVRQFDRIRRMAFGIIDARQLPSTGAKKRLVRFERASLDRFLKSQPILLSHHVQEEEEASRDTIAI